ncbi:hypothetical protein THAOC_16282, partial [Thalassiosira oceanica]
EIDRNVLSERHERHYAAPPRPSQVRYSSVGDFATCIEGLQAAPPLPQWSQS